MTGTDGSTYTPPASTFHDSDLDIDCQPLVAADGTTRCLPPAVSVSGGYFADPSCTVQVALVLGQPCRTPDYVTAFGTYDGCAGGYVGNRVYRVTGTTTSLYMQSGPSCVAGTVPAGYTLFVLGAEVSPSLFVQLN